MNGYLQRSTTDDKPQVFEYIPIGRYVLRETSAPFDQGYVTVEDVFFEIKDVSEMHSVTMLEDHTKIEIYKKDATDSDMLPGVQLQIKDMDGNVIDKWEEK